MAVAKLSTNGALNSMKPTEGIDYLDTFIKRDIGKEPVHLFGDSSVQWIQLLHALDRPDRPGWPLLIPAKMQMCEKCSREFCSLINYRRHIRIHRRSLNVNQERHENRDLLATFWDKLSMGEVKELMSFSGVVIKYASKEISGSSVIMALASALHTPGVWNLPQAYVKAGSKLVDIIHAKPSRLPISSAELFSILDDAAEGTFLCAGTAESMEKYSFEGETAKSLLKSVNLVANVGFLFEKQLVKAWFADKDAEALRCQNLLVAEEEAALKRQADNLEKKRQKRLRQKEQRVKELYGNNEPLDVVDSVDATTSAEASDLSSPPDFNSSLPQNIDSLLESLQFEPDTDHEAQVDFSSQLNAIEPHVVGRNGPTQLTSNCWQVPKPQRVARSRFHVGQNRQTFKPNLIHKQGPSRNWAQQNGTRVWTKKYKIDSDNNGSKPLPSYKEETNPHIEENEVLIGSIPIALKDCVSMEQEQNAGENLIKADNLQSPTKRVASKHWRPVSRGGNKNSTPVDRINGEPNMSGEEHLEFSYGNVTAAKEFLARRWKEAISGEHVMLVLSSPHECPSGVQNHSAASQVSDIQNDSVPGNSENQVGRTAQVKYSKKPEKELKIYYIPKQKA